MTPSPLEMPIYSQQIELRQLTQGRYITFKEQVLGQTNHFQPVHVLRALQHKKDKESPKILTKMPATRAAFSYVPPGF